MSNFVCFDMCIHSYKYTRMHNIAMCLYIEKYKYDLTCIHTISQLSYVDADSAQCTYIHTYIHTSQSSFVGVVQTGCPIHEVILDAVEDARSACKLHLRDAPSVYIDGFKDLRLDIRMYLCVGV